MFDQFMALPRFGKRQDSIDHRFQLPAEHALHDVEELAMAAHRRSEHLNLPEEYVPKIGLGSKTRGSATGEYTSAAPRRTSASHPCIGSDVIDDNINPALIREVPNSFVEFLCRVIDQEVGAEFLRPLKFFSIARRGENTASDQLCDLNRGSAYSCTGAEDQNVFTGPDVAFS